MLFRFFNLFLAVLIFITSSGFVVQEHDCLIKGKSISIFGNNNTCFACKKTKPLPFKAVNSFKKNNCCSDKTTYKNLQFSSQLPINQSDNAELFEWSSPVNFICQYQPRFYVKNESCLFQLANAPPLTCQKRLQLNQIFMI